MALPVPFVIWLVSIKTLRVQKHRIAISAEAGSDEGSNQSEGDGVGDATGPQVWALALVNDVAAFHPMLKIPSECKRQLRFWQQVTCQSLNGAAFIFEVVDLVPLPRPIDVQQFGATRFRSFLSQLEPEQGPRLWNALGDAVRSKPWIGQQPAAHVLRAPEPYIQKLVKGTWNRLLLPHLPNKQRSGSSSLTIGWDVLGCEPGDVPAPPVQVRSFPAKDLPLSPEVLEEAIDFLQTYASTIVSPDQEEEFENVEYSALERCVAMFLAGRS